MISDAFKYASVQIRLVLVISRRDAPKRAITSTLILSTLAFYAGLQSALTCLLLILFYETSTHVLRRATSGEGVEIGHFRTAVVVCLISTSVVSYGLPGTLLMQQPSQAAQFSGFLWMTGMAIHIVGAHSSIVMLGWGTAMGISILTLIGVATAHPGPFQPYATADKAILAIIGLFWAGNMVEVLKSKEHNRKAFGHARYMAEQRLKQLDFLASHDALTGLLNRRAFKEALLDSLGFDPATAVLAIDLDRFKPINDRYGHQAGDAVLVEQARRIEDIAGKGGVARLGGDEFAVLVRNATNEVAVETLASALRDQLQVPVCHEGQMLEVGASVGLAFGSGTDTTAEKLAAAADAAMYRQKAKAGDRRGSPRPSPDRRERHA